MIKVILFDVDGVIVRRNEYFSQRLVRSGEKINETAISSFFQNEFLLCETGKLDLKEELTKRLSFWNYKGTVQELMQFWFEGEAELEPEIVEEIKQLRTNGIKTYVSTNNEKYRTAYLWETVGLKNFMDGLFSSAYVGHFKSEVGFWEKVYKVLSNFQKSEILVWDNEEEMVKAAKKFGFNAEVFTTVDNLKSKIKEYLNA